MSDETIIHLDQLFSVCGLASFPFMLLEAQSGCLGCAHQFCIFEFFING